MTNKDTVYDNEETTNYVCLKNYNKILLAQHNEKDDVSLSLKVGSVCLGTYKILKVINEDQFGFIYLAEKNDTDKKRFIIKEFFPKNSVLRGNQGQMLIKSGLSTDALQYFNLLRKIFMAEAENLTRLSEHNYPNIIRLIKFEKNINNTAYIVTSYEEGMTFKEYLGKRAENTNSKLTNKEIIKIIYPLMDTLEYIHSLGILYLDIKPENIFLKTDGTPILINFRASAIFYDEDKDTYCNAYTPRYASPEQIMHQNSEQIEQTSDVYTLGILLYHLITNAFPPTAHERIKSIVVNKEEDPYVSIFEHVYSIGYEHSLLKAIDKALSFSKRDRFQSIVDFKNAILGIESTSIFKLIMGKKVMFYLLGLFVPVFIFFNYFSGKDIDSKSAAQPVQANNVVVKNKIKDISVELSSKDKELQTHDKISIKSVEAVEQTKVDIQQEKKVIPNISKQDIDTVIQIKKSNRKKSIVENTNLISPNPKQQHSPAEMTKELKVKINIVLPVDIGKTKLKVNGKELFSHELIAQKNKTYTITIQNPYYQTMNVKRTFDELEEFPEQTFIPILGKGKLYLSGLVGGVDIKLYKYTDSKVEEIDSTIVYKDDIYEMILPAGKRFYMTFYKKGYKPYKTDTFILKHGKALTQTYSLEKKDIGMKPKNVIPSVPKVKKKIEKKKQKTSSKKIDTTPKKINKKSIKKIQKEKKNSKKPDVEKRKAKQKTKKLKTNKKIEKIKQKASTKKTNIAPKETNNKKSTKKRQKDSIKKRVAKTIKEKSETKKKPNIEKRTKKQVSNHIWYCHAKAVGTVKVSAKGRDKQVAMHAAIQKCKRLAIGNKRCQILNCFLLRH